MVASGTRVSGGSQRPPKVRGLACFERERREKMGSGFGCIFLTNLTNLAEILSSKMTFS